MANERFPLVDTIDAAVKEISTLVEGDYGVWA
jgi:hypothetical protein